MYTHTYIYSLSSAWGWRGEMFQLCRSSYGSFPVVLIKLLEEHWGPSQQESPHYARTTCSTEWVCFARYNIIILAVTGPAPRGVAYMVTKASLIGCCWHLTIKLSFSYIELILGSLLTVVWSSAEQFQVSAASVILLNKHVNEDL